MKSTSVLAREDSKCFFFVRTFVFVFAFVALSFFTENTKAAAFFEYSPACKNAHQAIFDLNFSEARRILQLEKQRQPDNVAGDLISNLADCVSLFISEDENEFKLRKPEIEKRLKRMDALGENSPYFLFGKAMILLQWAGIRIKFGEYYSTAFQAHKAYNMLEENEKRFPGFLPDQAYLGFLHAIVGSVPEQYKWLSSVAGFHGNIHQGVAEINKIKNADLPDEFAWLKKDAMILSVFTELTFQRNAAEARKCAEKLYNTDKSPVITFLVADIALRSGRNETALKVLSDLESSGRTYFFPYLSYMHGNAALNAQHEDADMYFKKFLSEFNGKNYIRAANQKLAWHSLLHHDIDGYHKYMNAVLSKGNDFVDEDKQALSDARSGEIPNVILLKARLYFDGGYYAQALAQFQGTGLSDFPTLRNQLEVTYRVGRIYHKQNDTSNAIRYYEETLKNGSSFRYYFAANSALQLGLIYEEKNDFEKAALYFNKCLSMRNHEYQNSIDQKAKSGLNRIGKGHE